MAHMYGDSYRVSVYKWVGSLVLFVHKWVGSLVLFRCGKYKKKKNNENTVHKADMQEKGYLCCKFDFTFICINVNPEIH